MEKAEALSLLGHPARCWIVDRLLEGPATQEELRRLWESQRSDGGHQNPGGMSKYMKPLLAAKLVVPPEGRGKKSVAHPRLTRGVLLAAAELALAVSSAEKAELDREVARAQADAGRLRKATMARGADEVAGEAQADGGELG